MKAIDDFYTHEGKQQNGLSGNNMKDFFRNTLSNLEKIKKDVKTQLQSIECFKNTNLNRIICCNWAICIERLQRDGTAI